MSIDHGNVLAELIEEIREEANILAIDDGRGPLPVAYYVERFRALAQAAEAVEDITDLVMQPGAACPTCKQLLHIDPAEAVEWPGGEIRTPGDFNRAVARLKQLGRELAPQELTELSEQMTQAFTHDAAQGDVDEWGSHMRRLARVGPFTARPGERYIDEDVAVIVLRRALGAAPSQDGES